MDEHQLLKPNKYNIENIRIKYETIINDYSIDVSKFIAKLFSSKVKDPNWLTIESRIVDAFIIIANECEIKKKYSTLAVYHVISMLFKSFSKESNDNIGNIPDNTMKLFLNAIFFKFLNSRQYINSFIDKFFSNINEPDYQVYENSFKPKFNVFSCSYKNRCRSMEDYLIVLDLLDAIYNNNKYKDIVYMAIFDGHGSAEVSNMLYKNLHNFIFRNEELLMNKQEQIQIDQSVINDCLINFDRQIFNLLKNPVKLIGSTCTVCIKHKDVLYTSWLGDSECCIFQLNGLFFDIVDIVHNAKNE
ncbi:hypothetical protein A3Q56_07134, partial [Intoshia linei]